MADLAVALLAVALAALLPFTEPSAPLGRLAGGLLLAFGVAAAWRVGQAAATRGAADDDAPRRFLRCLLYAHLFVLVAVPLLAAVRMLSVLPLTGLHAVAFVAAGRVSGRGVPRPSPGALLARFRAHPAAGCLLVLAATIVASNSAWGLLAPLGRIDDLTYHLVFPVEWMQSGTLAFKEVPFGNHSPVYHPKNAELFYVWALLPLRELFPVVLFQFVWIGFAVLALYDTFRLAGGSPRAAAAAAALFPVSGAVARQQASGYVDVAFALFFILAVNRILALRARPTTGGWLELGAVVGAFVGTKMLGLPLAAVILLPAAVLLLAFGSGRERPRAAHAGRTLGVGVLAMMLCGGWWYVRNALLTGNPVFPLLVDVGGVTWFDGAYAREAMAPSTLASLGRLAPIPVQWLLAAGAALTLVSVVRRRPGAWPLAVVGTALPLALAVVYRTTIPLDEERFVLALFGLACGALLVPLGSGGRAGRAFEWLALAAVLLSLGLPEERDTFLRWLRPRQLLMPSPFVTGGIVLGSFTLLGALGLAAARWRTPVGWIAAVAVAVAAFFTLGRAAVTSDPLGAHAHRNVRPLWAPAEILRERGSGLRVATTGKPASLALYGPDLGNRVRYVDVNDTDGGLFHHHVRRWPELREELRGDRRGIGYYRRGASYDAWRRNLAAFGADLLVVFPLARHARKGDYVRDAAGFPREAEWARTHPDGFRLVDETEDALVFEVLPGS